MKKLLLMLFLGGVLLNTTNIVASAEAPTILPTTEEANRNTRAACQNKTYYMTSNWLQYNDLIDREFEGNSTLTNTGVLVNINMLGNFSYPKDASLYYALGTGVYTAPKSKDEIYFGFNTGEKIKISEFSVEVSIKDENGNEIPKVILINGNIPSGGSVSQISGATKTIRMTETKGTYNLGNAEVHSIVIIPENKVWSDKYTWTFGHFQVDKYSAYRQTGIWSESYIAGASTKTEQMCEQKGSFSPNSSNWSASATTYYSPSQISFNYNQYNQTAHSDFDYDYARGMNNAAYSTSVLYQRLSGDKNVPYYQNITKVNTDWTTNRFRVNESGSGRYMEAWYSAEVVYWNQTKGSNFHGAISGDSGWCGHVTGSTRTPCYKHNAHSSNGRLNAYSLTLRKTYMVPDLEKALQSVTYEITNKTTGKKTTQTVTANTALKPFLFNEDGVWTVKATLKDKGGRVVTANSGEFKIDTTKPVINTEAKSLTYKAMPKIWTSGPVQLEVNTSDNLSGFKQGTYSVSSDDGKIWIPSLSFSNPNQKFNIASSSGKYIASITSTDYAGNTQNEVTDVYFVDIDKPDLNLSSTIGSTRATRSAKATLPKWTNQSVFVSYTASDNHSGVGYYTMPNGTKVLPQNATPYEITANGTYTFGVCDTAVPTPNCTTKQIAVTEIDKTAPSIVYNPNQMKWGNKDLSIGDIITDSQSGVYQYQYRIERNGVWGSWSSIKTLNPEMPSVTEIISLKEAINNSGIYRIETKATDKIGNTGNKTSGYYYIDEINPQGSFEYSDNAGEIWVNYDVTVTVNVKDFDSGINHILFPDGTKVSGGGSKSMSSSYIAKDGTMAANIVTVVDMAGNSTQLIAKPLIDKTPPNIIEENMGNLIEDNGEFGYDEEFNINLTNKDTQSGPNYMRVCVLQGSEDWNACEWETVGNLHSVYVEFEGVTNVKIEAFDNAGNMSETIIGPYKILFKWLTVSELVDFRYIQAKYNEVYESYSEQGAAKVNQVFYDGLTIPEPTSDKYVTEKKFKETINKYMEKTGASVSESVNRVMKLYNLQVKS